MTDLREQAIYLYNEEAVSMPKIAEQLGVSLWAVSHNLLKGVPRRTKKEWYAAAPYKPGPKPKPSTSDWRVWILLLAGWSTDNIEVAGIATQAQSLKVLWDYSHWIQCPRCGIATTDGKLCDECVRELEKGLWIPWPTQRMKNPAYLTEAAE